jgi:acyl-CoA synthetase (AMP-forming)/AMP-acid ligase II
VRVRGEGVIKAYLDNPEATARHMRGGWFHPGDLASFTARGALVLQGRTDDMMIFDGLNIYPAEIERALLQHPAVAEAAAFPVRSKVHQDRPAAAVVLRHPAPERDIKAWCRERIGSAAPHLVLILAGLPRNAGGKVVKRELQRLAAAALARRKR